MQFTRLRLNGFKSFVDPTDLVIQGGLTGVVGPNGCGKSNLLEALRWVMGESRPTAMRGGGMEDVIFAGTSTRPARNFAEVALHVDNADRRAPAALNDHDTIEIVRRITRDAGSAYKAQGRDVRARDVQMLFADASTGAHSPALVRQGQISELIHAKPKNRRRILEEAAGISGLYQRRHEAELKLRAAEQNLGRIDDTVEALAQQLAQLARQARQAARYREIGARLRQAEGLLLYRRWREASEALAAAGARSRDRSRDAAEAERAARQAAAGREAAEARLPALRDEDAIASALVSKLDGEAASLDERARQARERIERLTGRLRQLDRDAEREDTLNADADESIRRLETEAEAIAAAAAQDGDARQTAEADAEAAGQVLEARESALAALTEEVARVAARHQAAERQVAECRTAKDRADRAAAEARAAVEAAESALSEAGERVTATAAERDAATGEAVEADRRLEAAEESRAAAQGAEAEARGARAEVDGALAALEAEKRALETLLAQDRASEDRLLDRLRVADGYEAALGAALADDLGTPIRDHGTGWSELAGDEAEPLPDGADPLCPHVEAPNLLSRRLARIGVVAPERGAALQPALRPGQRLVSRAGHLWRWDGFHRAPEDAPSEAALRLQQRNRLETLTHDVADAEERAQGLRAAFEAARTRLDAIDGEIAAAREARRGAEAQVAERARTSSRAEADRDRAESRRDTAREAVARHGAEAERAAERRAEAESALAALQDPEALRAEMADVKMTVDAARMTMMAKRSALDELVRAAEARTARAAAVEKELGSWRGRLDSAGGRLGEIRSRRARTESELAAAKAEPARLDAERERVATALRDARSRAERATTDLRDGDGAWKAATEAERAAERAAGQSREARAAAQAQEEAARIAETEAETRIREALDVTPDALLDRLGAEAETLPQAAGIEAEIATLRQRRDGLGAVNLRAEEDAREVEAEHGTLVAEKQDLDAAIAELRRGIAGLNREGRERLLTAFDEVNRNFGRLFATLFGGGEARLELIESDDPLDAGLEILCQPPGKKLSVLSLLSGGEQTLTATALIFAVFLANPAPICVLDEVDAPLDDANVTRFCDLLDDMSRQTDTRFLVITHHAVTMARMDRLFGVTMGEQGVSQLVSVDLRRAEQMVA